MVEAYNKRQEDDWQKTKWQTWHIALLNRIDPKEFPSFERFTNPDIEPKEPQTEEEMLAVVKVLNAAFGGKEV